MHNGSIKNKQKSFSSVFQEGQEKRAILVAAENWMGCIMGSSY